MPDTIRLRAVYAVRDALLLITTANGYECDLERRVFIGRNSFSSETTVPLVTIFEPFDDEGGADYLQTGPSNQAARRKGHETAVKHDMKLWVQGIADESEELNDVTATAYQLLGCIHKALKPLFDETESAGVGGFYEIGIRPGIVRPPDNLSERGPYCLVPIILSLTEKIGDPYGE